MGYIAPSFDYDPDIDAIIEREGKGPAELRSIWGYWLEVYESQLAQLIESYEYCKDTESAFVLSAAREQMTRLREEQNQYKRLLRALDAWESQGADSNASS